MVLLGLIGRRRVEAEVSDVDGVLDRLSATTSVDFFENSRAELEEQLDTQALPRLNPRYISHRFPTILREKHDDQHVDKNLSAEDFDVESETHEYADSPDGAQSMRPPRWSHSRVAAHARAAALKVVQFTSEALDDVEAAQTFCGGETPLDKDV